MNYEGAVYRPPSEAGSFILQVTIGCARNTCTFCTMYKDTEFKLQHMEWIEEDLRKLGVIAKGAKTIQLLSANPLCMTYDKLAPILE